MARSHQIHVFAPGRGPAAEVYIIDHPLPVVVARRLLRWVNYIHSHPGGQWPTYTRAVVFFGHGQRRPKTVRASTKFPRRLPQSPEERMIRLERRVLELEKELKDLRGEVGRLEHRVRDGLGRFDRC